MNKLSIADLEKRSESVASQELLNTIASNPITQATRSLFVKDK